MNRYNFWLALLIIAGAIWAGVLSHHDPNFRVYFLNVGQGDSSYIEMPGGKDALIDGGPNDRVLTELGQIMPFYDKDLDLVIVTHNHADHLAGLIGVLQRYKVREIWISGATDKTKQYKEFTKLIEEKNIPVKRVREGMEKNFDQVKVRVVYPDEDWNGIQPKDQHEATVVTRWTYGKTAVLETGDLSAEQVDKLSYSDEILLANILKVPHHGSATGLNEGFLSKIRPSVAVITAGKNNVYGLPKKTILNLLKKDGVKVYRTDLGGRMSFESDGLNFWLVKN